MYVEAKSLYFHFLIMNLDVSIHIIFNLYKSTYEYQIKFTLRYNLIFLLSDLKMDDKSQAKLTDFLETYLSHVDVDHEGLEYMKIRTSLSVILEYFYSPDREYTPCSTDLNLYDNETIKGHKFQTAHYTPSCWFDSAVPFGFSNGSTNIMLDVMYLKNISVNELRFEKIMYPESVEDTPLWPFVTSFHEMVEDSELVIDSKPVKVFEQVKVSKPVSVGGDSPFDGYDSLSILCEKATYRNNMYDEAPLFRILLLLDCLQSPKCHDRYDYTAQNLFFQSYGFTSSVSWLQEINDTNKGDNAPGLDSSFIQCVTLSDYTKKLSGDWDSHREFIIARKVVIPVSQAWSGCSWLFPYIAAFTTTAWWNFGLVLRTQILDSTTGQPYGDDSILSFPEASTVHIPGEFKNILLVLIDSKSTSNFFVGTLKIPITDFNLKKYPVNFSLPFYKYLGRHGAVCYPFNVSLNNKLTNDVQKAMECIVDTVCLPGVLQRVISMVSETCRMRYHNNWVVPSRNSLEKESNPRLDMQSLFFNFEFINFMQIVCAIETTSNDELLSKMKNVFSEKTKNISQIVNSKLETQDSLKLLHNYQDYLSGPGFIKLMEEFKPIWESLGYDYASHMQGIIEERSAEFSEPVILNLETVSYETLDSDACDPETLANPKAFKNFLRQQAAAEMVNIVKKEALESRKNRQRYRYFTPMMNLTGKQQKIGDRELPLASTLSDEHLANLKIAAFSRVSPMHVIPASYARIQTKASKINFDFDCENKQVKPDERVAMPCFHEIKSGESQYNITEASGEVRLLIALSRRNEIEKIAPVYAPALTLEITRFASICGAVAEWTISSLGINFFDLNKLTEVSIQRDGQDIINNFWPSHTHHFIKRPVFGPYYYFKTEIIHLFQQRMGIEFEYWTWSIDQLHGGLLPWWYVCAVAKKFKCGPVALAKANTVMLPGDFEGTLDSGYIFASEDPWYSLPFYTFNNQYDHPMFQNYNMLYNRKVEPVAWYPDAYVDATRLTQSLRLKSPAPEQPKYLCEILTTPLETTRQHFNATFVSYSCPFHKMEDFIPVLDDMLFLGVKSPPETFIINFLPKKLQVNTNTTKLPETKAGSSKKTGKGSKSSLPKGSKSSKK